MLSRQNLKRLIFVPGVVPKQEGQMEEARESGSDRPPVQPLPEPVRGRADALRRAALTPEPLQPAVRPAETVRLATVPVSAARVAQLPAVAAALSSRRAAAPAAVGQPLSVGQQLPIVAGQHFGRAEAEAGVHGLAAALSRLVDGRDAARRRQEEQQHSVAEAEGQGARVEIGDAAAER